MDKNKNKNKDRKNVLSVSLENTEVVKLNVGGKKYMTTYSTLSSRGSNALTALLDNVREGRVTSTVDSDGFIFVDRCGKTFAGVLNYLRSGVMLPPPGTNSEQLLVELDYFSIAMNDNILEGNNHLIGLETPGRKVVRLGRAKIREDLMESITSLEAQFLEAMRIALLEGENCLDIIPAISYNLEGNQIKFKKEQGLYKLFGSQVQDELFLDELCSLLEDRIFGCPVHFGVKELRNFTGGTRAKAISVDLKYFLKHQS